MTPDAARQQLVEAVDRFLYDKGLRLPGETKGALAGEVLRVVLNTRTACMECEGMGEVAANFSLQSLNAARIIPCPACGGSDTGPLSVLVALGGDGNPFPNEDGGYDWVWRFPRSVGEE